MHWSRVSPGKYTLVMNGREREHSANEKVIALELRKREVRAESERTSGLRGREYVPRVFREAPRIGPRESGEAADRQYHGNMWNQGEW